MGAVESDSNKKYMSKNIITRSEVILNVSTPRECFNYLGREIGTLPKSGVSEPQIWHMYSSDFSCTQGFWGRGSLSTGFCSIALVCFLVLMNPFVDVHSFI